MLSLTAVDAVDEHNAFNSQWNETQAGSDATSTTRSAANVTIIITLYLQTFHNANYTPSCSTTSKECAQYS